MNKEIFDKWVEALESGNFKQAYGFLKLVNNTTPSKAYYCCLGVLCEITNTPNQPFLINSVHAFQDTGTKEFRDTKTLPMSLARSLDMDYVGAIVPAYSKAFFMKVFELFKQFDPEEFNRISVLPNDIKNSDGTRVESKYAYIKERFDYIADYINDNGTFCDASTLAQYNDNFGIPFKILGQALKAIGPDCISPHVRLSTTLV